jgi:hypothetical protein
MEVKNSFVYNAGTITVTLLPGSVVPIFQAGDPLELTCIINGTFIRWSVTVKEFTG